MPEYEYEAVNPQDKVIIGRVVAGSPAEARERLEAQQLEVTRLEPARPVEPSPPPPPSAESEPAEAAPPDEPIFESEDATPAGPWWRRDPGFATMEAVAELTQARLPLAAGLRAISEESPSRQIRRGLEQLSARLEAGEPLEAALEAAGPALPRYIHSLIRVGSRSGNLTEVLEQYLLHARAGVELRRQTWLSLAYPLVLLLATLGVIVFFLIAVIPRFRSLFDDFGMELPGTTLTLLAVSDIAIRYGLLIVVLGAMLLLAAAMAAYSLRTAPAFHRVFALVPVLGTMFQMAALSQYCHLLALLVENRIGLSDALRMAGQATRDANLREVSRQMALELEHGRDLGELAQQVPHVPLELRSLFHLSQRRAGFIEALQGAGDIFAARARVQSSVLGIVLRPIVILAAVVLLGATVLSLFLPLINLLNALS